VPTEIIKLVKNKGTRPLIFNSGKTTSTASKIIRLITELNRPKVMINKGKETTLTIGLIKALANPKTKPQKIKISVEPEKLTPGISLVATQRPKSPMREW